MKRVTIIVLDSFGIGELPDANQYGDVGSNTYGNIKKNIKDFNIDNMGSLGFYNIDGINGKSIQEIKGSYGRSNEKGKGKDTTTGHWEMAGLTLHKALPLFPHAFPVEMIDKIEKAIGRKVLGNEVASGTEIIGRLGAKHMETGYPIVYTSADSVLQIATHEDIIPLDELYSICEKCREILIGDWGVGRVIARPFINDGDVFTRTPHRRDFSLKPTSKTMLDYIVGAGQDVIAIGKIEDIFAGEGISRAYHTASNIEGINVTIEQLKQESKGLIFTNLVEFDMNYGHRNDVVGYANALMQFDQKLPSIIEAMNSEDVLIITADHGCDPTTASTDHSREYTPILIYGEGIKQGVNIGTRETFADIAATVLDILKIKCEVDGKSFLSNIKLSK